MKKNQKGFSAVEILISVVVIGLIGAVGWLVYDRQSASKDTDNDQTTTTQEEKSEEETTKTNGNTVKFTELGVQISVPDEIKDIVYVIEKQTDHRGKEVIYARLTTRSLQASFSDCDAEGSSIGVIAKGLGTLPTDDEAHMYYGGSFTKQYGDFFVTYEESHAACADSEASTEQQQSQMSLLEKSMTTLSVLN